MCHQRVLTRLTSSIDIDDYNRKAEVANKVSKAAATGTLFSLGHICGSGRLTICLMMTGLADLEWHTLPVADVVNRWTTSLDQGLSQDQIKRRVTEYGKNTPSPPETRHFQQIMGYFFKGFGSVLLVGSILVFVAWKPLGQPPAQANLALAIVLLAVFFIQAAFNMWQDWSSSRVMASIKNMIPEECLLIREGVQVSAMAADIVPGDVLLVKAGNKLPADVRFVQVSSDAKFDRSILTGESANLAREV